MNIIIANKKESLMYDLNIDILEKITGEFSIDELAEKYKTTFYNKMIIDITAIKNYEDINTIQSLALTFPTDKMILLLDDSPKVNNPLYMSQLVSMGIFNFTKEVRQIAYLLNNPNSYKDVANFQMLGMTEEEIKKNQEAYDKINDFSGQRIIGVYNQTPHAGSTTLTYLLTKHLQKQYRVQGVEFGSDDLGYFQDDALSSIEDGGLEAFITEHENLEVIVVDLADSKEYMSLCSEVVYLIEPGKIQLNRMLSENKDVFDELYDKKIVLNRSILSSKDIEDFEREAHVRIFYNIPNIDDKQSDIKVINAFLSELGFTKFGGSSKHTFSIFK